MIVLTSNLGADILVGTDPLHSYKGSDGDEISPAIKKAVMDVVNSSYPPEFLNRIDEFVIFQRLTRTALREIVDIRLRELQQRLEDRRIRLEVGDNVKDWLCEKGYDPRFGARPLNRLIAKEVGNGLADKIIRGEIKSGDTAKVAIRDGGQGLVVLTAEH